MLHIMEWTSEDWDIVTAFRGPDNGPALVKDVMTAPTRWLGGARMEYMYTTHPIEKAKELWEMATEYHREEAKKWVDNHAHFKSHIDFALQSIDTVESRGFSDWLTAEGLLW